MGDLRPRDPQHVEHIFLGEPEEDLILALEPDQLVSAMDQPVPRRQLSRPVSIGLWFLRILLLLVSAMVIYVFAAGVASSR